MKCIDIQRGKEGTKGKRLQQEPDAAAACTVRLIDLRHQQEHPTKDLVMSDT